MLDTYLWSLYGSKIDNEYSTQMLVASLAFQLAVSDLFCLINIQKYFVHMQ